MLALEKANLSLNKLLMINCDGPNVNNKLLRLMNERLFEEGGHGLINVGACSLHKVHHTFLKRLEEMGVDDSSLIVSVLMVGQVDGKMNYTTTQQKLRVLNHRFMKHATSFWLTIGPAAEHLLKQWDAKEILP